jgi:hypothetical protein
VGSVLSLFKRVLIFLMSVVIEIGFGVN